MDKVTDPVKGIKGIVYFKPKRENEPVKVSDIELKKVVPDIENPLINVVENNVKVN